MKISQQLKEKNIAEYLIYMWQVEDLIHTNKCDVDFIHNNIISRYPTEEHAALKEWYRNLADMIRAEGMMKREHLQINHNVTRNLTDLHAELLVSTKYPFYNAAHFKALPSIVELRQKNGPKEESELGACFEALYGVLLLRLQKKKISQDTTKVTESISNFLSLLVNYYGKGKEGRLKLKDDRRDA